MLTQEHLKSVLHYDPETGIFTRIKNRHRPHLVGKPAGMTDALGYRVTRICNIRYKAHRLAWLYVHGYFPEFIDHINGVKTDNRLCNLRAVTKGQNNQNAKKRTDNKSGYKGVSWNRNKRKWIAQICKDGKVRHLGNFNCPEEAHEAYTRAALELHGEFAHFG